MKNILSVCAFLLVFGALPLWGQSQDPLNEDQTTVRILEGDNSDPSIVRYGKSYYLSIPLLFILRDWSFTSRMT